jgi:hypothetical protein
MKFLLGRDMYTIIYTIMCQKYWYIGCNLYNFEGYYLHKLQVFNFVLHFLMMKL